MTRIDVVSGFPGAGKTTLIKKMLKEAWKTIFDDEKREALYKEARQRGTVRNEGAKIYPNDPCPCGRGKKFKACHGRPGMKL